MILMLSLVPFLLGVICLVLRSDSQRRLLWVGGNLMQLVLTMSLWVFPQKEKIHPLLDVDSVSLFFLTLVMVIFLTVSFYTLYFSSRQKKTIEKCGYPTPTSHRTLTASIFFFLSGLVLCMTAQHFGIYISGMVMALLASGPILYYRRTQNATSAMWKFLLMGSVSVGLLMIGYILLSLALPEGDSFSFSTAMENPHMLQTGSYNAAVIFILIGLGSFWGIAPLHLWIPETNEVAPGSMTALLSGGLSLCAFLGILRFYLLSAALGELNFISPLFLGGGLLTLFTAAFFMIIQTGYKRLLAYVLIGQNGIIIFGLGLGTGALPFVLLHCLSAQLILTFLLLLSENFFTLTGSYSILQTGDLYRRIRFSAIFWVVGLFAVSGFPPFGLLATTMNIIGMAISGHHYLLTALFLILLFFIFVALSYHMLRMIPPQNNERIISRKESLPEKLPILFLVILTLYLGIHVPPPLSGLISEISRCFQIGGFQ